MNKDLFEILQTWPKIYISGIDLKVLLEKSDDSRYSLIKRALKQGVLISLRRDLYVISSPFRRVNYENQLFHLDKSWLQEALKKKILRVDWKKAKQNVGNFLRLNERRFVENWTEELFLSQIPKIELV